LPISIQADINGNILLSSISLNNEKSSFSEFFDLTKANIWRAITGLALFIVSIGLAVIILNY